MNTRHGARLASIVTFILLAALTFPYPTHAQQTSPSPVASLSSAATVSGLQALITTLEAELKTLLAAKAVNTVPTTSSTSTAFTRTLSLGSTGSDVSALQQTLKNAGFYAYPTITGSFGTVTELAVQKFQSAHGIVSSGSPSTTGYGVVGPRTRDLLNSILPSGDGGVIASSSQTTRLPSKAATPVPTTSPTSSSTTSSQSPIPLSQLFSISSPGYGGGGGEISDITPPPPTPSNPNPCSTDYFPSDSGIINVRNFGAVGDGVTDDTAAILRSIAQLPAYSTAHLFDTRIIYFPAGTYLVSGTILRQVSGAYQANLVLIGECRTNTTIKLSNAAPGYSDSANPKAVIYTSSGNLFGQSLDPSNGSGNEGFNNTIENMTVDVGTGNPGAIGIDYLANNMGAIRNVTVTTSGPSVAGISMDRSEPGPALISNVAVNGSFGIGIDTANTEVSMTLDNVQVDGATAYGLRNEQNLVSFNSLTITMAGSAGYGIANIDPVSLNLGSAGPEEGMIVGVNGVITGSGIEPLLNTATLNFKNVLAQNFVGSSVAINTSLDGVFHGTTKISNPDWELPIESPPTPEEVPSSEWTNAAQFGATTTADATAALRAALSSATSSVVYIPTGIYSVSGPITISDNIDRIEGMFSIIQMENSGSAYSLFQTTSTRTKPLYIRRLIVEDHTTTGVTSIVDFKSPSPSQLIMSDITGVSAFTRESGAGQVFGDNISTPHVFIHGSAGVWLRQFNPEVGSTKIFNDGAPLWILGLKTEQPQTILQNSGGANTEIVGGFIYSGYPGTYTDGLPMFLNTDSRFTAAYVEEALRAGATYPVELDSTISGVRTITPAAAFPTRGAFQAVMVGNLSTDTVIPNEAFANTSLPVISGAPDGETIGGQTYYPTLSATTGTWALPGLPEGAAPTGYVYQWYRDGVAITNATTTAYAPVTADNGHLLQFGVKAIDSFGTSTEAVSAGVGPVSPTAGLKLWLDASASTTITQSGGKVSQWNDLSGNGNNAVQPTSSQQPTIQTAGQNGLNTIRFTGAASQFMTLASSSINVDAGYTIIAVIRRAGPTGANSVELLGNGATGAFGGSWDTNSVLYTSNAINYMRGPSGGVASTGYNLVSWELSGTTGQLYVNGGSDVHDAIYPVPYGPANFNEIGNVGGSSPEYSNGEVAEFMVFDSVLSNAARQAAEQYLKTKWGTP
jgi:peptidoglycan hydrolase-like protein with peptidoglycan-binding domain